MLGNTARGPKVPLQATAFEVRSLETVGTYAVQPIWGDGHSSGIYSYDYLRKLGENAG